MTPSARLQATLDLLDAIENTPRPADAVVSAYFRSRRYIGSKDRSAVATKTYDILRHRARLGWWLEHSKAATATARALLMAYLMLVEETEQDIIIELFSGGRYAPSKLDDDERALLKKLHGHTIDHPDMPDGTKVECPDWALASLQARFGKNFLREMNALLRPAPLDLRVNPLKATRDDILAELRSVGAKAEPCRLSILGVRVQERPSLAALPMLKNGSAEIQDEGSQLVALLVGAKPGERVVDFCAGAGGKTLAIAAQMKNKGRIIACDVLEGRLKRSTERFRRAGLHNIEIRPLKNENDPWVKRHRESFDRVLVDAPCGGAGAWRRNPDARWRSLGPGLKSLLPLQASILESAARLVKPGGRLIYATCSLLPEENERQVETFLEKHTNFELIPVKEVWPETPCADPYLSLTPAQHNTDGFFAAVMKRAPAPPKEPSAPKDEATSS